MEKALNIGKVSVVGSVQLFIGKIVSTVILALGTIIIGWFITPEDYGLYAIALIPATLFLLFQDWGVGYAMARRCAQCRATGNEKELGKVIIGGLFFEVATGVVLTISCLVLANYLAVNVYGKPEASFLITLASVNILSTSIFASILNILVGFEKMKLYSIILIVQAVVFCTIAPFLIYIGYGALGAIIGNAASLAAAGILSLVILYFEVLRKIVRNYSIKVNLSETLKPLLSYGVPLAVASILGGLLSQFYSFMMASLVNNTMIGNYKIATNFSLLLAFFSIPIATVLFPAFSKVDPKNEKSVMQSVFSKSVKYSAFLMVPATLAMILLSNTIIGTLYGSKYPYAWLFLAWAAITNITVLFGNLSLNPFFSAVGETRLLLKLNIVSLVIGVPAGLVLVPKFGIVGVIIGPLLAGIPSLIIGLYLVRKRYEIAIDLKASLKILIAAIVAVAPTYLILNFLSASDIVRLVSGFLVFLFVFVVAAPLVGAILLEDIDVFRAMFSGLGALSIILEIPFILMEKVLALRGVQRNNNLAVRKDLDSDFS